MPRAKKTVSEDASIQSDAVIASAEESAAAEVSEPVGVAETPPPEQDAPKKRKTRKKAEEPVVEKPVPEEVPQQEKEPSDIESNAEIEEGMILSDDKGELPTEQEKSAAELAEELKSLREKRESNQIDGEISDRTSTQQSTSRTKVASVFRGTNAQPTSREMYDDELILNELNRYCVLRIPIFCIVIGVDKMKEEVYAICQTVNEKYREILIYVPFSELDIPTARRMTNGEKQTHIETHLLDLRVNVCITNLNRKERSCEGSVRLGNLRLRKAAFFDGVRRGVNVTAEESVREVIGIGTTVEAYIIQVNNMGVTVNIFGATTRIRPSELSHKYIANPIDEFFPGDTINVKILDLETDKENNYSVRVTASIKALHDNDTIKALEKAKIDRTYTATVCVLPNMDSSTKNPIANADLGFNIIVLGSSTSRPYTVGSRVKIEVREKNKAYAVGYITAVLRSPLSRRRR